MDITPLVPEGRKIIQRYGAGKFYINDDEFDESIFLLTNKVLSWKAEEDADYQELYQLIESHQSHIEVVLFGLGAQVEKLLPLPFKQKLSALGIASDVMNTGAACRTYNVLLAEGRKVAAAIMPVE